MKKSTKLGIWEVWNEGVAESVYVAHKPTDDDIREIIKKEKWPTPCDHYIHVSKLKIYWRPKSVEEIWKAFKPLFDDDGNIRSKH